VIRVYFVSETAQVELRSGRVLAPGLGGVIRHPICSAIVYVTGGIGGPTLVTNQTRRSKQLAKRGWLVGRGLHSSTSQLNLSRF